ncbi:acyltransferase family protein [Brachybacterium sp. YJGR34]|uniref:acyltransferase family protein n=1 Tax=Brachybacterium sp. YJGR34 TaxID=2059911 RepID=UPI000E0C9E4A|nr:acyltransferase family protein [Brachybacterium sp. YJGR34]
MTYDSPPTLRAPAHSGTPSRRLHHLDALRGGALLLGVLLHALMPFAPGGLWLVPDSRSSWTALGAVAVIHLFRMTLFMMLAGFFGHMVLQRRGVGAYLRDRMLRIGLPLVAFWPVLFALMIGALVLNAVVNGGPVGPPEQASATGGGPLALPTMHLWFLLLLLEIVLVVVTLRAVLVRMLGRERAERLAGRIGEALAAPYGLVLVAIPYVLGLLAQDGTPMSITEPYTLMPVAGASIAYGGAFLAGWFLRAAPGALEALERRWIPYLVLAVMLSPVVLLDPGSLPPLVTAVLTGLAGWAWVYGLLGLAARVIRREIPAVRYLSDSSYWIYLLHFPLLLLVEVPLAQLALPIPVKLAITLAVVMTMLLLSYDLLVRSTWLGAWLNGRRRPRALRRRGPTDRPPTTDGSAPEDGPVATTGSQLFTPPAAAKPRPRVRPRNRYSATTGSE